MQNALYLVNNEMPVPEEASEDAQPSFASLIEQHSRVVYRIALAVARNPQDAEDVVQEAFLQLYRGARWGEIEDPRAYLARIAWRLAVRRHRPRPEEQELPPQLASLAANPEEWAADRELEVWLHAAIDRLPEKLRQPLALAALGELKLVEIAALLNLPEGTVRRRIHTARQKLKQQMNARKGGKR